MQARFPEHSLSILENIGPLTMGIRIVCEVLSADRENQRAAVDPAGRPRPCGPAPLVRRFCLLVLPASGGRRPHAESTVEHDNHSFEQAASQPCFEIFAEKKNSLFLKVVDAPITVESDATGRVTGLILHQAGQTIVGKRVE